MAKVKHVTSDKSEEDELQDVTSKELEEMLERIIVDGQRSLVHVDDIPSGKPPWFDEAKYEAGKQMVSQYYGGLLLAHLVALALLVYSPQVLKPLIFTGKSETPEKSYRRYISTSIHVLSWYRGDIWRPGSLARQSLHRVRIFHSQAAIAFNSAEVRPQVDAVNISHCGQALHRGKPLVEALRQDLSVIPDCPFIQLLDKNYTQFSGESSNPAPYFNQLDMSVTQFAFVSLVVLHPEKFGMKRATKEELEGFIHLWRCVGWILGIEDRYNFCRWNNLSDMRRWIKLWTEQIILPTLKSCLTLEYEHMGRAVILGARPYAPYSYETVFLFIGWVLGISISSAEKQAKLIHRRAFRRMKFLMGWFFNLPLANRLLNAIAYWSLRTIVDPPRFWPFRYRPPFVSGLKDYFYCSS